jgi:hypothetical protein
MVRTAVETVAEELTDGDTEVSVLLPDRKYRGIWHRILHDRTAEAFQTALSRLPHANVTTVPFHFDSRNADEALEIIAKIKKGRTVVTSATQPRDEARKPMLDTAAVRPIGDVRWRDRVRLRGVVKSMRVAPQRDVPTLECVVDDGTGTVLIVFLGRREVAGLNVGSKVEVVGTVGVHQNRLAILNPTYQLASHTGHG